MHSHCLFSSLKNSLIFTFASFFRFSFFVFRNFSFRFLDILDGRRSSFFFFFNEAHFKYFLIP